MPQLQVSAVLIGNRNLAVTQALASRLLNAKIGEKFDRLTDLQSEFSVGAGTIQSAIKNIEMLGGVKFRRSGHQGTRIENLDPQQLWLISGRPPLIGMFPSFSAKEMQKARDIIRNNLLEYRIPFNATEQTGAKIRIQSVIDKSVDFAVISNSVIDLIDKSQINKLSVFYFDEGSYYEKDSLVILFRKGIKPYGAGDNLRTGIDPESSDHFRLSEAEFGKLDAAHSVAL